MAEEQPQTTPPPNAPASQETTMRELNRQRREASAAQEAEPISADAGMLNVPFLGNRALKLANENRINLERPQFAAGPLNEVAKRSGRMEAARMALSRVRSGRNSPEQRAEQNQGQRILNPTLGFGTGGKAEPKKVEQQFSTIMMGGLIRGCWGVLWETFGHTIYIIDILFLAQAGSKYLRRFIPAVGEEWFPPKFLKLVPKTTLLPLKLAEICGMAFITFWVFMLDMLLISIIAIMYAAIDAIAKHV